MITKTGRQLIYEAYRDLGCLRPNQGMAPDVNTDGINALNELVDALLVDELMVFTNRADIYPLVPGKQYYTIGQSPFADFVADRPTQITEANVILNPGPFPVSPTPPAGPTQFHTGCDAGGGTSVSNGGGPVLPNYRVQLVFWGAYWGGAPSPTIAALQTAIQALLAGPYLSSLAQYGVLGATYRGSTLVTATNPPFALTATDVETLLLNPLMLSMQLPTPTAEPDVYYLVVTPPGLTSFGEHTFGTFTGPGAGRFHFAFVLTNTLMSDFTRIATHELVEGFTDPEGTGWQVEPRNPISWNEICDVCCSFPVDPVTGYTVASYWSATDLACILPIAVPAPPPTPANGETIQTIRIPLGPLTVQEFANVRVRNIPNALPQVFYYDAGLNQSTPGNPLAQLFIWPGPLTAYGLELFTWQQLVMFADLDTVYLFPPAYARMLRKNLAVEMAPMMRIYQKIPETLWAEVQRQARESKQAVQDFNAPDPLTATDPAFRGSNQQGEWNYVIGDYNRYQ